MKYIILAYNYLTLIRAIKYIDCKWGRNNSTIIYLNLVSELPLKISEDYIVKRISCDSLSIRKRGILLLFQNCFDTKRTWKQIKDIIDVTESEIILVLFKDNEILESTIIENSYKKYNNKIHIWMMEEGSGIYALEAPTIRYSALKRVIYPTLGISRYVLKKKSQGLHPYLEKIICTKPELFENKKKNRNLKIEQMEDIFTQDINKYFIQAVIGKKSKKQYTFVFLTQPFKDWADDYNELLIKHETLLPQIFKILSYYGKTIIKLHPREHYNYEQYLNQNIELVKGEENNIPFECLIHFYGEPQMISMFSSTSINIISDKPSIYLGKMFGIPMMDKLFTKVFYEENNIISCNCLNEFETIIRQSVDKGEINV